MRYARFRGAQARLGRNWRAWPARGAGRHARERPTWTRRRSASTSSPRRWCGASSATLRERLDRDGFRLGLDLAVGVPPRRLRSVVAADAVRRRDVGGRAAGPGLPERTGLGLLAGAARCVAARGAPLPRGVHRPPGGSRRACSAWTTSWRGRGCTGFRTASGCTRARTSRIPPRSCSPSSRWSRTATGARWWARTWATCRREIYEALPRHRIWGMYLAQFQAEQRPRTSARPTRRGHGAGRHARHADAGGVARRRTTSPSGCTTGCWRREAAPGRPRGAGAGRRSGSPKRARPARGRAARAPGGAAGVARRVGEPAGRPLARGPLARGGRREPPRHAVLRSPELAAPDAPAAGRDLHRPRRSTRCSGASERARKPRRRATSDT